MNNETLENIENVFNKDDRFILKQDPTLPKCVICDLDGTIALNSGRYIFDDTKLDTDFVWNYVADIIKEYNKIYNEIIYITGRDEKSRVGTETWLKNNNLWFYGENQKLFMRPRNDNRRDTIIKKEIYNNFIKDKYYVSFVLEDRKQVVDMWRSIGLCCLQVYDNDK